MLVLAALAACGTPGAERDARLPSAEERRARAFTLTEVARSDPDALFALIGGLDVDSRGRIFVADLAAPEVTVLAPDGRLERTVGRRGSGPGEFQGISSVQVLPDDSLLVFDRHRERITVFGPSLDSAAYTVNLASRGTVGARQVHRTRSGGDLVAVFTRAYSTWDDPREDASRMNVVRLLGADGALRRDSMLMVRANESLVRREGRGVASAFNPFGGQSLVRFGPGDRLYHAWTDSLGVTVYGPDGTRTSRFRVDHPAKAVDAADVEQWSGRLGSAFRPALDEAAKGGWPALDEMVVDDAGRVWLRLSGGETETREWLIFSGDGRYERSAFLPAGTVIHQVRANRVFTSVDPEEEPRIAVYALSSRWR
ncbi:MAG TPA: 6-bladed beta-propeller [Longimicrobium sp.]|nr:6-bladed beta-propeller [Longimicrobium sp.]